MEDRFEITGFLWAIEIQLGLVELFPENALILPLYRTFELLLDMDSKCYDHIQHLGFFGNKYVFCFEFKIRHEIRM